MVSFLAPQVDLFLQISIFIFLIAGFAVERKRKVKAHANLMLAAVVLNLVSFVAIMAPAWDNVGEGGGGGLSTIGMLHVTFGGLTILSEPLGSGNMACANVSYAKFETTMLWQTE